jgi:hypothetical protein
MDTTHPLVGASPSLIVAILSYGHCSHITTGREVLDRSLRDPPAGRRSDAC